MQARSSLRAHDAILINSGISKPPQQRAVVYSDTFPVAGVNGSVRVTPAVQQPVAPHKDVHLGRISQGGLVFKVF